MRRTGQVKEMGGCEQRDVEKRIPERGLRTPVIQINKRKKDIGDGTESGGKYITILNRMLPF